MSILQIKTAKVFLPLLQPARYKGVWGGRGSGKSQFFGDLMVEEHLMYPGHRSVCIREVQKTLNESAKRLIEDKIEEYGLAKQGFRILRDRIETPGDGVIIFMGMADHNNESIKSLEGFDRAWFEEAQTASKRSLQLLRPTIRKPGSELWFSWNPSRKVDAVDVLLRGSGLPSSHCVVKANWDDNPWLPDVLNEERLDDKKNFPDSYDHVWDGGYITAQDGAYFAAHLLKARGEQRINQRINVDPMFRVRIFCDIGGTGAKSDAFTMWAVQYVGHEIRLLNYYESQGQPISAHNNWLRDNDYLPKVADIYLPHDGDNGEKVYDVTYKSAFEGLGYDVEIVPNQGKGAAMMRVNESRSKFHMMYFDAKCEAGVQAIGWYHEKKDDARGIGLGPDHDWSSHAADSFGMVAICYESPSFNIQRGNDIIRGIKVKRAYR
jgi:phage terminase large subunit